MNWQRAEKRGRLFASTEGGGIMSPPFIRRDEGRIRKFPGDMGRSSVQSTWKVITVYIIR